MSLEKPGFRRTGIPLALSFLFSCAPSSVQPQSQVDSVSNKANRADPEYDKARYDKMQSVIDGSMNKLLGTSLKDASRLLSLGDVSWDKGYTSVPFGQLRIYHFKGFYLLLSVEARPQGASFREDRDPDPHNNDAWRVANFYPSLQVDGIVDPHERMRIYWDQVQAGFRKRTEQMNAARAQQK